MRIKLLLISFACLFFCISGSKAIAKIDIKEISKNAILAEDNFLPIIAVSIAFKNQGAAYVELENESVPVMLGFIANRFLYSDNSDEILKEIQRRNIKISFSSDVSNFYINLVFLAEDRKYVAELLRGFFYNSEFKEKDLTLAKEQVNFVRSNRERNSGYLASRNIANSYIKTAEYRRTGLSNRELVEQISLEDLGEYLEGLKNRDQTFIAISGAIKPASAKKFVRNVFGDFESKGITNDLDIEFNKVNKFYKLEGFDQTRFYAAMPAIPRSDENFYSFYVLNHLFGGSTFNSRVTNFLREEQGLTYSASSAIDFFPNATNWQVSFASENSKAKIAKQKFEEILENIKNNKVTKEEVTQAKGYLTGSYDIYFTSNANIAGFLLRLMLGDLDLELINYRNELVEAVTLESVRNVQERLFEGNDFSVVVTGVQE